MTGTESLLSSTLWGLVQMILTLGLVIALAYLVLNKGLGKWLMRTQASKIIKIRERIPLDNRRALYLVEVNQRTFVLGGGDGGISLVMDLSKNAPSDDQA